jgi:general secretion pathway protein D
MPVEEVLEDIYAPLVGRTPFRANIGGQAIPKDTLITLKTYSKLTRTEAIIALETVMGMNGITVVPIGDKFFKVVPVAAASTVGGLSITSTAAELPVAGKFITEIVQLKYANPDEVTAALGYISQSPKSVIYIPSTQSLILRDYTENVKRMLEMIEKLDMESPLTMKWRLIPIKYAMASDISSALGQLGAGVGGAVGHPTTGASFTRSTAGSTTGLGGVNAGNSPYGAATQAGASTGAGGRSSSFGQNLARVIQGSAGAAGAPGSALGQTKVIADERTNSLLIYANDDDMKMITNMIDKLDVVLAQVLIEAIILEVNLTDGKNLGVSFAQNQSKRGDFSGAGGVNNLSSAASSFLSGTGSSSNGVAGAGTALLSSLPGGFSYFGKYGNDWNAVLEAVATDSRVSVLSRPQIQTSHGVEAEIFIGNTVPYVTGTANYGYSTGPSANYTQLEVGIRMRVLPLINVDGLVEMDIDQEIEQLGPSVAITGVGNVPTTTKRDAGAKVAVMSGQTVILGGFISASRSLDHSGVPWLMNIPMLGNLFKSTAANNTRTELIVLMRPTVLKTPEIAAKVATEQRDQMAAVKQAELAIRKDEDERNATANRALLKNAAKEARNPGQSPTNPPIEFHFIGTNESVNLHLNDTNSESVIELEKP